MSRAMTRSERLDAMKTLYLTRAYSDSEMAERLGVDRTTVFRDRAELEREYVFDQVEHGHWRLDRTQYLTNLKVNLPEALSLYLAARRMSQQTRVAHTPVASALEKLAVTLQRPMTTRLLAAADQILAQRQDPTRTATFATVAQAWIEQRWVRLHYRAFAHAGERIHRFAPYLLEPSPWNDGIYLIGQSDLAAKPLTLKLDRITKARLLGPFDLPDDFDEQALLRHAWGIWGGEGEPQRVALRFAPGPAARRLQESIWHPLEQVAPQEDGGCLWAAPIADWQEMVPWVRGWGAGVEVLAPADLRAAMAREAAQLAEVYGNASGGAPVRASGGASGGASPHYALYAKTARPGTGTGTGTGTGMHALLYHLLDVGQVAHELWRTALSPSLRAWVTEQLNVDEEAAGRFLAFMAALHDLGKAGPAFQLKYANPAQAQALAQAGFVLRHKEYSKPTQQDAAHGIVSTWALTSLLVEYLGVAKSAARDLATAVGGHHGAWPGPDATRLIDDRACPQWAEARRDLLWEVRAVFQPPTVQLPTDATARNVFLTFLSALTSVADWIGSREEDFPFVAAPLPTRRYAEQAARQAQAALAQLGWVSGHPPPRNHNGAPKSLTELFPTIAQANAMQAATLAAAADCALPALVIIEAPTGSGKTETALTLADGWMRRGRHRGLYVAMPTQATSNQMFGRVVSYLAHSYPQTFINVNLAHGQAALQESLLDLQLATVGEEDTDHIAALGWFMEQNKRALLAPFGVGTVDQALLAILLTRHFFVRLLGIQDKVVIFDEVHAYDTYMSTLLDRLLAWLAALGTSVIMLSATLPGETRRRLVKAYTGREMTDNGQAYPQVTVAARDAAPHAIALPAPPETALEIAWLTDTPAAIADALAAAIADRGCVAVICNTVRRAQELYQQLDQLLAAPTLPYDSWAETELWLFHARFPPAWRAATEQAVLDRFGKTQADGAAARPRRAIVIATQVIEQSLDLDFDVMLTELAPIDLLLQRAGRLHRHDRGPRAHPRRLTILQPPVDDDGLPQLGTSGRVYAPYVLLRTYAALRDRTQISLPQDTRALIDAVYGPRQATHADPAWQTALRRAYTDMKQEQARADDQARQVRILPPDHEDLLSQPNRGLEEDNPAVHASFQARTRDIGPSVGLVVLFQTPQGTALEPDGAHVVNLSQTPTPADVARLDRYVIQVQHWAALRHFVAQEPPAAWRKSARLRHCRAVLLDNGVYRWQDQDTNGNDTHQRYLLRLRREFGLEILREES